MKKKQWIPLAALFATAAVLLVVYFAWTASKKTKSEEPEEQTSYFSVMEIAVDTVDRITIANASFTGSFVKKDGSWVYEGQEFFPVRQKEIENLLTILLSNLNAFRVVENPAELSEYGLLEPVAELSAYAGEQKLVGISLGNALLTADERYELMDLICKTEQVLKKSLEPDAFNVGFNLGKAAGAGLAEHLHCHVVPRWNGDTNFLPVLADVCCLPQAL